MSDGLLIQTMQGILARLDQIDDIKAEIKEEYAQAKAAGYDKTALGVAIREIRGRDKAETPAAQERAAIVDLYVSAFDNGPRTYVHVPAREAVDRQSPSEGEVGNAVGAGAQVSKIATPEFLTAAQSEAAAGSNPEQGADESAPGDGESIAAQSAQFVTPSGEGEGVGAPADPSPAAEAKAFKLPQPKPLRPNCLKPERCGGYGSKHCGACERAAKARDDDEDGANIPAFVRKTHEHAAGDRA